MVYIFFKRKNKNKLRRYDHFVGEELDGVKKELMFVGIRKGNSDIYEDLYNNRTS